MPIRSLADLANTTPMMSLEAERDEILPPGNDRAHSLFLQLGLALLISHFRGEHLVNQNLLEDYDDRILKRIQRDTVQDAEVRYVRLTNPNWPAETTHIIDWSWLQTQRYGTTCARSSKLLFRL